MKSSFPWSSRHQKIVSPFAKIEHLSHGKTLCNIITTFNNHSKDLLLRRWSWSLDINGMRSTSRLWVKNRKLGDWVKSLCNKLDKFADDPHWLWRYHSSKKVKIWLCIAFRPSASCTCCWCTRWLSFSGSGDLRKVGRRTDWAWEAHQYVIYVHSFSTHAHLALLTGLLWNRRKLSKKSNKIKWICTFVFARICAISRCATCIIVMCVIMRRWSSHSAQS